MRNLRARPSFGHDRTHYPDRVSRMVQPYRKDRARQPTIVSGHATAVEAFAEIDRIAAVMMAYGSGSDYLELVVVDADSHHESASSAH